MYLIEPILSALYRRNMQSVLKLDGSAFSPRPPEAPAGDANYLLYIHIPFCESLCPYCSFHRYSYDEKLARPYFYALLRELRLYRNLGYKFKSVYVGGGTPTVSMGRLIETLGATRDIFGVSEISIETNPNHLTERNLELLKGAGVNRLSVGAQSFDDSILKKIGRFEKYGSSREVKENLKTAVGVFDTLNIDLIFNIPTQTEESLRRDLDVIEEILPEQVTFYPLMVPRSVESVLKKDLGPMDYKREKKYYAVILDRMNKNYTGSTAWCFSRKKGMIDEYIIDYDKYVGAGCGAFGHFNDCVYINAFSLDEYIEKLEHNEFPISMVKKFSERENARYFLLMKLFGLSMPQALLESGSGKKYKKDLRFLMLLLKLSHSVRESGGAIELTDKGKYYWIMAMRAFIVAVDTVRDRCREMIGSGIRSASGKGPPSLSLLPGSTLPGST